MMGIFSSIPESPTPNSPALPIRMSDNSELLAWIAKLEAQLRIAGPSVPAPPSLHPREGSYEPDSDTETLERNNKDLDVKIKKPDYFRGDPITSKNFFGQLMMYTDLQPRRYSDDHKRIIYAGSLFCDWPASWWTLQYMTAVKPSWMYNWAEFQAEVTHTFNPTNRKKEAAKQLSTLKQTKSAAKYYTRFLEYSVDAGFNEESMVFTFCEGLKPKIKDALSTRDYEPDTLVDLAELCVQLDQHLYKRQKEGKSATEVRTERTVKTTHEPCQNLPSRSSTAAITTHAYSTLPVPNPFRRPAGLYMSLLASRSL